MLVYRKQSNAETQKMAETQPILGLLKKDRKLVTIANHWIGWNAATQTTFISRAK